jgi:hypothetical protein
MRRVFSVLLALVSGLVRARRFKLKQYLSLPHVLVETLAVCSRAMNSSGSTKQEECRLQISFTGRKLWVMA